MFVEDLSETNTENKRKDHPNQLRTLGSFGNLGSVVGSLPMSLAEMAQVEEKRERALSQSSSHSSGNTLVDQSKLRHTIVLSSHDSIVPIGPVSRYLETKKREGHGCFEVTFFHGHHGEMMIYPTWVKFISRKIRDRCNLE